MPVRPSPDEAPTLRAERDRFVAFAFSAADILLELDSSHVVRYAAGAVTALLGIGPHELEGRSLLSLAPPQAQPVLGELLLAIHDGRRLEPMAVRLQGRVGPTPPLLVVGYELPNLDNRIFLALRMARGLFSGIGADRQPGSGLLTAEAFAQAAAGRVGQPEGRVTFIELEHLDELNGRLDGAAQQELTAAIGQCLRANSLDGDGAAGFDGGRYGLVHAPGLDIGGLGARLEAYSRAADPAGSGVAVRSVTLDMDFEGVSQEDAARALVYTIHQFGQARGAPLTVDRLSSGLAGRLEAAARQMASVRALIAGEQFVPNYQPIVRLSSRQTSHFEALVRFSGHDLDLDLDPFGFIRFAEEVGLIADFDIAMCRRVLDELSKAAAQGAAWPVAVNISGRSLEEPWFRSALQTLLGAHPALRRYLLIEITESMALTDLGASNAFIQALRRDGHKVCLDDFGVGAVAFEYLRALEVDYVKIDGSYVRDTIASTRGGHFLKAIGGLCRDLGVATVAEMVEREDNVPVLIACGIDYGQGHLFGRPAPTPRPADTAPARRPAARRMGARERWE